MNYHDKNIEIMKASQARLYEEYLKKKDGFLRNNIIQDIQTLNARDGECILSVCVASRHYRLNSSYHPTEEAKRWAEQFELQNMNTVVAMFGLGNGILTRALIERMGEKDYLLLYEPCLEIFEHVLEHYDITDILSRENTILIVEGINEADLHFTMYSMINISNIKSQLQCIYPNYDNMFRDSCIHYYKEIKNCFFTARININTGIHLGEKFIENTLKNLRYLNEAKTLSDLKQLIPKDLPAIIVAAGPSVQENIDELKKAKGKAIIIAVDRILDYLLDSDLIPDFVISVDPIKKMEHFSSRKVIDIPLICYLESNPDIMKKHKGCKIVCTNCDFIEGLYHSVGSDLPRLGTSGSVAIVAYRACLALGFKRVILVGQDLAYSNGCSHVGGVTEEKGIGENTFVEGLAGELVRSRHDWVTFITQYQDLIAFHPDVEVIDAKQQGARIKGTVTMPLQEAIQRYASEDREWKGMSLEQNSGLINTAAIKKFLEDNLPHLKEIRAKAKKAVDECDRLLRLHQQETISHSTELSFNKLHEYNEALQNYSIYTLLDSYISAKTAQQLSEIGLFTEDHNSNSDNTLNASKVVYQAAIDAVDFTRDHIRRVIRSLR